MKGSEASWHWIVNDCVLTSRVYPSVVYCTSVMTRADTVLPRHLHRRAEDKRRNARS